MPPKTLRCTQDPKSHNDVVRNRDYLYYEDTPADLGRQSTLGLGREDSPDDFATTTRHYWGVYHELNTTLSLKPNTT
jgi:hypothetical protein